MKRIIAITAFLCLLCAMCVTGAFAEPSMPEGLVEGYGLEFDNMEAGEMISKAEGGEDFFFTEPVLATARIENGNGYISKGGEGNFAAQFCIDLTGVQYAFAFDTTLGGEANYFVKGCDPIYRVNPAWKDYELSFVDSDYYRQNGGTVATGNSAGGSGIALWGRDKNRIGLTVKTFETDGLFVGSRWIYFDTEADLTEMNSYLITDDGAELKYYINGEHFATVEYSEVTTYPLDTDDTDQHEFYKNVKVKNAAGEVVSEIENSRLAVQNIIAIGYRVAPAKLDNVKIFVPESIAPVKTEEPTPTPTDAPTEAPTEQATAQQTEPVPTQAPTGADNGWVVYIIIGGVIIAAAVIVILLFSGKKKAKKS